MQSFQITVKEENPFGGNDKIDFNRLTTSAEAFKIAPEQRRSPSERMPLRFAGVFFCPGGRRRIFAVSRRICRRPFKKWRIEKTVLRQRECRRPFDGREREALYADTK